jgi:hypothetical protein
LKSLMASLVREGDLGATDWTSGSASLGPAILQEPHLEADTDPPDTIPPITPQYRQLAVVIAVALWQQVARFVEAQLSSRWTSSFPPMHAAWANHATAYSCTRNAQIGTEHQHSKNDLLYACTHFWNVDHHAIGRRCL